MNKVLSQDEVDALLRGVSTGDIETEKSKGPEDGVRSFDLTSQERIIRGRMPGLEMANERFARSFRNSISSIITNFVEVNIQGVTMMKFSEFMKTIPMPSSINMFKMEPLKGYALFVIEAPMVFALVEYFFGGSSAKYVKSEGRYFTQIEQRVIRKVVDLALHDMADSWNVIAPIIPEYTGSEMNPQFVTIVTPTEVVIKIEIHIEVDEFTGKLFFCIPYSMVEPLKERLCSGIQGDKYGLDDRWVMRLKEILLDSYVELCVEVGRTTLPVGELMNLEVGDVITLGKAAVEELDVKIGPITKFKGLPGYSRGTQAVKITKYAG
ncbi:MAG: flagellar motor switch protein FliM [Nitrospiraceae bacterium]|nr:flagellar motor switch protein FliM [Nitrospiraceae bacterium]